MQTIEQIRERISQGPAASTRFVLAPPAPPGTWPAWAQAVRAQALAGEPSVVETLERLRGPFGGDAFKAWYAETFGPMAAHCNCAALRDRWAAEYRYERN